jgi:hypothetical protein
MRHYRTKRTPIVLLAGLLLSACSAVYSPVPMGEAPVAVEAEAWEGTWLFDGDAVEITAIDPQQGKLRIMTIDGDELESGVLHLRSSGDWTFASYLDEEDEDPDSVDKDVDGQPRFLWGRIVIDNDRLIFWAPDVDKFRNLVEAGKLPGNLLGADGEKSGNVYLTELSPEHYALITSEDEGVLLEWDSPGVAIRVAR